MMYSGNHKFGRGAGGRGGGATKRNVFGPSPPLRLSSSSSSGKLSLGGSRNPPPPSAPILSGASAEESFSLIGGDPLSFAAIIRLAPDLVEEIKRVEAQGGAARIKFDSNPNNSLGNVIDVGGKEFRFTWSRETGGLCDVYEERQGGEDVNGLLVESGCAWRKLNVQRVLDESAKNHVKRLSEEAERQLKSRKAKFLDPSNASMKSQIKALAAAEASPWKFKSSKNFKKKFEPPQVGGPPKSVYKPGFPSAGAAKGRHSASPLPSPQNQSVSLASPSMRGNVTESHAMMEDTAHIQPRTKENAASTEKELTPRSSDQMQEAAVRRDNQVEGTKDLQNLLITLLKENPKGMSIKTLEKAVADSISNAARKIEPFLKKIATVEPSGVYILKPGVELESQKRSSSESGSSPEDSGQKQHVPEDSLGPAPASDFAVKSPLQDLEEQVPTNELNLVEKIDPSQHFSVLFGDEPLDNGDRRAASAKDSGSDSDSDSSDSSSDSGSRSRSRSPAGTASGSSSDGENDSSSNSKEGSDVEIDILNDDDDKEPKKLLDAEHALSRATVPWSIPEAGPAQDGNLGDQEGYASEDVDIEKLGDNEAELASISHAPISTENLKTVSADHDQSQPYGVTDVHNELDDDEEEFKNEQPDKFMIFKGKSKRGSDVIQFEENSEHIKRLKAGSMAQSSMSGYMGGSSPRSSPDIANEDHQVDSNLLMSDSCDRNDNSNVGMQRGNSYPVPEKFALESLQSGHRPPARSHDMETADKFGKNTWSRGLDVKHQEANAYKHEGFLKQGDKGRRETRDGEFSLKEKVNGKSKQGGFDQKQDVRPEPYYEKHSEDGKKSHTTGNSLSLQSGSSPNNGGQAVFERASVDRRRLQRELSDLELGELREPLLEEPEVTKKQFERGGSFKQSDTKSSTSGSQNADLRGRPTGNPTMGRGSPSLPNSRAGGLKNSENWSKRRSPEPSAEVAGRLSHQAMQSQPQQSRVARAEVGSLLNKAADANKLGHSEGAMNQEIDIEGYGESQKKSHVSAQLEESKQDLGSCKVKGNKSLKSNTLTDAGDRKKDASLTEGQKDKRKKSEFSLDEDVSYSKYDKEEPELKGPIKSLSEYKEYVNEYCKKYESYCSLNKILESYRNDFQKMGMDLDSAKGRDMEKYYNILAQLRESYRQCGTRHKRLKKIFIVLHEELKHLKQRIKEFALEHVRV